MYLIWMYNGLMTLWNKLKLVLDFQNSYNFFISFLFVGLMSFVILKWTQTRIESRMEEKNMTQSVISDDQFLTIRLLVLTITNALHWEKNTGTQHRWILIFDIMLRPKPFNTFPTFDMNFHVKFSEVVQFIGISYIVFRCYDSIQHILSMANLWFKLKYTELLWYMCVCVYMVFFCLV